MTLLMCWSGLRTRDAVALERNRLHGDSLVLYQAKIGTPVYVPLPPHVVDALENVPPGPKPNPRYFFRSGNGQPKSVVADWQLTGKPAGSSYARQTDRKPMKNGLLQAGTGVLRPLTLYPRMNQFPVPIERLEKDFG
jgi:integrase